LAEHLLIEFHNNLDLLHLRFHIGKEYFIACRSHPGLIKSWHRPYSNQKKYRRKDLQNQKWNYLLQLYEEKRCFDQHWIYIQDEY